MSKLRLPRFRFGQPLILTLALLLRVAAADAASIAVDTTADDTLMNGNCTLREAILAANGDAAVDGCAAGAGADTIILPAGTYALTLTGASEDASATGDLDVTSDLDLLGAGATTTIIDGASADRVLDVRFGAHVTLTGVTIQHGVTGSEGGGIRNRSTLALTDCVVRNNTASVGFYGSALGGGIQSTGPLEVTRTTIESNRASSLGFSIADGGGINAMAPVGIHDSIVRQNVADGGMAGSVSGGGVFATDFATVDGSTMNNNSATGMVGGPLMSATAGGGLALTAGGLVRNSTLTGNSAFLGGDLGLAAGALTLENVTLAGTLGYFSNPVAGTTITFRNTMVMFCLPFSGGSGPPITTVANDYNLTNDTTCPFSGTDQVVMNLGLLPLADNGGPTPTRLLSTGSPALDGGNPAPPGSGGGACLAVDQRGVVRPQGARCDIGAVEGFNPLATTTTSSTTSTSTSSTTTTTLPPPLCDPTPRTDCLAAAPRGAALSLRDVATSLGDALGWSWRGATAVAGSDFGNPLTTTSISLCLYDATGLRFRTTAGAGAGWTANTAGFKFTADPSGPLEPKRVSLRSSPQPGRARISVSDKTLDLPSLPLTTPVRVQVRRNDGGPCWEGVITMPTANTSARFRGRSD